MAELDDIDAPIDPLDEQLTAYLDGELSPADARAMEESLGRQEPMRMRLRELAGTWDLLDELPRTNVDETFAQTTVAMIAVVAAKDVEQLNAAAPRRALKQRFWSVAAVVAAAAIGYVALTWLWPDQNRQLLNELSLVENWPLYQQAGSVDFIRELDKQGLFAPVAAEEPATTEVPATTEESARPAVVNSDAFTLTSITARRDYLAELAENQRADLRRKHQEFQQLPREEQERYRAFERELQADPTAHRLHEVLQYFHGWLVARSPLETSELLELSAAERVAKIKQIRTRDEEQLAARYGIKAPMLKDLQTIVNWMEETAWKNRQAIFAGMKIDELRFMARMTLLENSNELNAEEIRALFEKNEQVIRKALIFHVWGRSRSWNDSKPLPVSDDELQKLEARLSETARQQLRATQLKPEMTSEQRENALRERAKLVRSWIGPAIRFTVAARGQVSEGDLQKYYEKLPEEQKRELKELTPDDFKRELRRKYLDQRGSFGGGPGWGGDRGEGRRGDGGRNGDGRNGDGRKEGPSGEPNFPMQPRQGGSPRDGSPPRGEREFGPPGSQFDGPPRKGPTGQGPPPRGDQQRLGPPPNDPPPDKNPPGEPKSGEPRPIDPAPPGK